MPEGIPEWVPVDVVWWEWCHKTRSCDHYLFHLCTVPVSLDSEPSLAHLMDKVAAVIPSKYELVGLQLGLTLPQLQAICPQHQSLECYQRAFGEIFGEWRRHGSPPYTWRTLIGVLRSASVGEVLLSEQLTSWITQWPHKFISNVPCSCEPLHCVLYRSILSSVLILDGYLCLVWR